MSLLLGILGTHFFLCTIFITLLCFDDLAKFEHKRRDALISIFIPILGTLYVADFFRRRRTAVRYIGQSIDESNVGTGAIGLGHSLSGFHGGLDVGSHCSSDGGGQCGGGDA